MLRHRCVGLVVQLEHLAPVVGGARARPTKVTTAPCPALATIASSAAASIGSAVSRWCAPPLTGGRKATSSSVASHASQAT